MVLILLLFVIEIFEILATYFCLSTVIDLNKVKSTKDVFLMRSDRRHDFYIAQS